MKKQKSIKINAALNGIRQISTMLVSMITFMYISRVLHAENVGKYSWSTSIVDYFSIIASLGIGSYALREGAALRSEPEKERTFCSQVFSINIFSTLAVYAAVWIFLVVWHGNADYKILIAIYSVQILFNTIGVSWLYGIYEDYLFITAQAVISQLIMAALVFILVNGEDDLYLYAALYTGAGVAANIFSFIYSRKYMHLRLTLNMDFKRHIRPMLVLFASVALINIYINFDITMIGVYIGDKPVGLYKVATKIYSIVKNLINAMVIVSLPRISYYLGCGDKASCDKVCSGMLKMLIAFVFPAIVGLAFLSGNAIYIVAGPEYLGGKTALQILSASLLFATVANFFVNVIMISQRKDTKILISTALSAAINVFLNIVFIPWLGITGAAITTLISEITVTFLSIYFCRGSFKPTDIGKTFIITLCGCLAVAAVCVSVSFCYLSLIPDTVLKILLSAAVYFLIWKLADPKGSELNFSFVWKKV